IVDHYQLGYGWENALRSTADRLMVIEDLPGRRHECDLLLDQNLVAGYETRHASSVAPSATMLLGPTFGMLSQDYRELRKTVMPRKGKIRRIVVSFGATNPGGIAGRTVQALM